jgi:hypothetical protein
VNVTRQAVSDGIVNSGEPVTDVTDSRFHHNMSILSGDLEIDVLVGSLEIRL